MLKEAVSSNTQYICGDIRSEFMHSNYSRRRAGRADAESIRKRMAYAFDTTTFSAAKARTGHGSCEVAVNGPIPDFLPDAPPSPGGMVGSLASDD
jgi:hypothetical protein